MSKLWRKKKSFKRLAEKWYGITEILPYERFYETLTPEQLLELLQDAKRLRWQVLDLSTCGLETLPPELGNLPDLQSLDLGNIHWVVQSKKNTFSVLPDSCCNLSNLQSLDLSYTPITSLPDSFGNLSNLQSLNLSYTPITSLPDSFGNLSNLQSLDLTDTSITSLPDSFGNLFNLQSLDLIDTSITSLPDSCCNLSNLQSLRLDRTQIITLPDSFGNLSNLQSLDLTDTSITSLPDSFGNLFNLQRLCLSDTQITTLPDSFGKLSNLKTLDLMRTSITSLPDSFGNLSNLKTLCLDDTPLYGKLPPEIQIRLPSGAQEAIRYILEMQSNAPKRYFNETKMVVVGQGSVGKSCLINRLIHGEYENQHSTEGIDIEPWDFSGVEGGRPNDHDKYRLNVWDFGGQEIYHATHQFFLTRRTLYVLMWDALTEDEYGRRDYWMRTIRSFAGDSPVIIVVNKCDKDLGRYPQAEYAFLDKYPQILNRDHVFYISCRDNIGIDELRDYILSEALKMPLMKTEWLEKWLNIRKELETLSAQKNYIHYGDYEEICAKYGVTDEQETQMLIQYLHDLGVIIHYHDDELLCGLVILSPEWGTDAVYKVLDEQQRTLKGQNGILRYADLPKIWSDKQRYPKSMYPYLLKLMEKFQLAFEVDNPNLPKHTYLVAELLSENPMPHEWQPEGTEPLAFRYEYDFMPAGVMTRLIVSIHQYLEDINGEKQCWRKGAYLKYGSARAKLVLYDGIDRKYLDVRIIGDNPRDRSELLTVVREHVQGINSRFQKIEITELVPCKCSPGCPWFWSYRDIRNGETQGETETKCPKTWKTVQFKQLLDGVAEMKDEKGKYGGILTPVEEAEMENHRADTRLKKLYFFVGIAILVLLAYLLIMRIITIEDVPGIVGNLPG